MAKKRKIDCDLGYKRLVAFPFSVQMSDVDSPRKHKTTLLELGFFHCMIKVMNISHTLQAMGGGFVKMFYKIKIKIEFL